ncbi:MAG TPA: hypothetical protein VFH61_12765 [Thermoleophilia bacterium]|nr:hypothetical protein [Thermoleophilia bacterium]
MPSSVLRDLLKPLLRGKSKAEADRLVVELVNTRYEGGTQRREPYMKDWQANLQFYAGNQWIVWDNDSRAFKLRADSTPTWAVRTTENRFLRLIVAAASLLLGDRTQYQCIPGGDTPEDREAAKLGNKVTDWAYDTFELEELYQECSLWMLLAGIVGVDTYWDPDAGPLAPIVEMVDVMGEDGKPTQEPVYDEYEEPVLRTKPNGDIVFDHMGDVRHTIIPPTHFIPDPYSARPKDLRWYIYHTVRPVSYILERWPDTGKDVVPENIESDPLSGQLPTAYSGERGHLYSDQQSQDGDPGVVLKQMVVAPCKDFAIGGTIYVVGDTLLAFDEGLDEHCLKKSGKSGGLGMHMARCYPRPGCFWPVSAGDLLRPLQKNLNQVRSQIFEAINQTVGGKWLVPRSANLVPGSLHTKPAERVLYDAPFAPAFLQPSPIPRFIIDVSMAIPQWLQELNQTHQATLGQAPRNLRSGLAIAEVQEQDEIGWSMPGRELDRCMAGVMGRTLWVVQQNYVGSPRQMQIFDEDTDDWQTEEFLGADLTGVADVRVVQASSMRRSKAKQQAYVMEFLNGQVGVQVAMQYPEFISRVMEALDLGHMGTVFSTFRADAGEARREIKQLEKLKDEQQREAVAFLGDMEGVPPPEFLPRVDTYQDHRTHMKEHGDDLKDPRSHQHGPVIRALKIMHFNAHAATVMAQMMAATAEESPDGANSKAN